MACGCATCVSEIESYLSWDSPADHAIFFPVGGFDDAVSGLSKLVENKGIRDVLGRKGIEVSRGFSFDRVVDRIKGFIEDF